MTTRIAIQAIPLSGLPDGLQAFPIHKFRMTTGGEEPVRSRRRLLKIRRVALGAEHRNGDGNALLGPDRSFVLGAGRRSWAPIVARFGARAFERAVELARSNVVWIDCPVDEQMRIGTPTGWRLREPWREIRETETERKSSEKETWVRRARAAAEAVLVRAPELAEAIEHAVSRTELVRLQILTYAAEDLADGVLHLGPRAFSQAHFEHTKVHDDAPKILRSAGVSEEVIIALGLQRSSRLGLGGCLRLGVDGNEVAIDLLRGPTPIRTDESGLNVVVAENVDLIVIENLQAADHVCDRFHELAVVYTAGLLSAASLALMGELGKSVRRCAVIVDADLGGVRIAEQVLAAIPRAELIDVGQYPHRRRDPFAHDSVSARGLQAASGGPAGPLARAILTRGYPVEQERSAIQAVQDWRRTKPSVGSGSDAHISASR